MRNYGCWLCLLPPIWALVSILSVRTLDALPQLKRHHTVAGYVLWTALVWVLAVAVRGAYEGQLGYQVESQELNRSFQQQKAP